MRSALVLANSICCPKWSQPSSPPARHSPSGGRGSACDLHRLEPARRASPSLDLGVRAGFHQCGLVLPEDDLRPDRVVIPCQEGRQLLEFGAGLLADRRTFELEEKIC